MKRAWIQNILIALLALVLLGALVYFVLNPGRSISSEACRNIVVEVSSRGSSSPRFLTQQQVIDELSRRGLRLKGQKLDSIDLRRIERSLTELGIYDKVRPTSPPPHTRSRSISRRRTPTSSSSTTEERATTSPRGAASSRARRTSPPTSRS